MEKSKDRKNKKYFLGADIGTHETKAVLTDEEGRILAKGKRSHETLMPEPGFAEHDPDVWWSEFCSLSHELIKESAIDTKQLSGICCSAIACGLVAADKNHKPLRNAILYGIDTRTIEEIREMNDQIGEERIESCCGDKLSVESFGPKIRWIQKHEPEIYRAADCFTFGPGFINLQLTGKNCIDRYSTTFGAPMYDCRKGEWNDEMCSYVTEKEKLPEIHNASDIIGYVTLEAEEATGIPAGTPVLCGTTDAASEALSVGAAEVGDTVVMYGSTIFIVRVTDRLYVENNPLWKAAYLLKDTYTVLSGMATAGSLTQWLLNVMGKDILEAREVSGENEFQSLFSEAEKIAPGAEGLMVLPYFAGERMPIKDPKATGMMLGLTLGHTRGHIVRASLEGIGYALSQNIEAIRSMGIQVEQIMAIGGGTKSPVWMQIMSDITGIPHITYAEDVGASYGDTMLAALGTGCTDINGIKKWNHEIHRYGPNPEKTAWYDKQKPLFAELYLLNKKPMHKLREKSIE